MDRVLILSTERYSFTGRDNGRVEMKRVSYCDAVSASTDRGRGVNVVSGEGTSDEVLNALTAVPGIYDVEWRFESTKAGAVRRLGLVSLVQPVDLAVLVKGAVK